MITIEFNNGALTPVPAARDSGVIIDSHIQIEQHISAACRAAYCQLHAIACVHSSLTQSSAATLAQSPVISKLDYGNCLLYDLPDCLLHRLQLAQNSAARMVYQVKKNDHIIITPALKGLLCTGCPPDSPLSTRSCVSSSKHCIVMPLNTLWMFCSITNQRGSCDQQARLSLSSLCPTTTTAIVYLP